MDTITQKKEARTPRTYLAFLRQYRNEASPRGDIARDVFEDKRERRTGYCTTQGAWPVSRPCSTKDFQAWWYFLAEANNACEPAVIAFVQSYQAFAEACGHPLPPDLIEFVAHGWLNIPYEEDAEDDLEMLETYKRSLRYWSPNWFIPFLTPGSAEAILAEQSRTMRQAFRQLSFHTRFTVFKRDDYRCRLCGMAARDGEEVRLEVDHITSRKQGGTNTIENLWTLCFACNRGKGVHEL